MGNAYTPEKEYSASGLPTAIADEKFNILWKNNAGGLDVFGESAGFLLNGEAPCTGLLTRKINGESCTFNVIKRSDSETGKIFYVIELVAVERRGSCFTAEAVRDYIFYVCAGIKTAVKEISSVTDRLFDEISAGSLSKRLAAESLDRVCKSAAMLEREADSFEKLHFAVNSDEDNIIILDREMSAVVSGVKTLLDGIRISEDYDRDIFFRMNADAFEAAVASIAAECCGSASRKDRPERIIFSARRSERDRAEVAVMLLDTGARSFDYAAERPLGRKLFSEYIYNALEQKKGVRFSRETLRGGFVCRMNIEALPRGAAVLAAKPVDGSGRRLGILEKLAFFFGGIPADGEKRYTSRSWYDKNDGEPEWVHNIYREEIENEETKI